MEVGAWLFIVILTSIIEIIWIVNLKKENYELKKGTHFPPIVNNLKEEIKSKDFDISKLKESNEKEIKEIKQYEKQTRDLIMANELLKSKIKAKDLTISDLEIKLSKETAETQKAIRKLRDKAHESIESEEKLKRNERINYEKELNKYRNKNNRLKTKLLRENKEAINEIAEDMTFQKYKERFTSIDTSYKSIISDLKEKHNNEIYENKKYYEKKLSQKDKQLENDMIYVCSKFINENKILIEKKAKLIAKEYLEQQGIPVKIECNE